MVFRSFAMVDGFVGSTKAKALPLRHKDTKDTEHHVAVSVWPMGRSCHDAHAYRDGEASIQTGGEKPKKNKDNKILVSLCLSGNTFSFGRQIRNPSSTRDPPAETAVVAYWLFVMTNGSVGSIK